MNPITLGQIKTIDPRTIWRNEERDFTPWLADNIEALSDAIGFPIEVEQTEKSVGKYELDIVGKVVGTDKVVVIENQLEKSDHKHLGQLITYAAGLNASIIIWVTPYTEDEHRRAIEWLNEVTDEQVNFFLVRPEAYRINDSVPAVKFYVETAPSHFVRNLREAYKGKEAPRHLFRKLFWQEMYEYLAEHGHPNANGRQTTSDSWVTFSVGKSGVSANVCMGQGSKLRIELLLDSRSTEQNDLAFDMLARKQAEIEKILEKETVVWDRMETSKSSRIAVNLPYDKARAESDEAYRQELFAWISPNLARMRKIGADYLVNGNE
ncbi:DUF4268 domain-containing protein [Brevibacillus choshinensis]|uniref:DUF4268 domain-containing protein n=1 Tax=Brevibacillus choshinensis TaxID=54911 RepID=UPI002E1CAB6E|nr:DUF4268 domain-containing protein [Brevibacillus choshinensis]